MNGRVTWGNTDPLSNTDPSAVFYYYTPFAFCNLRFTITTEKTIISRNVRIHVCGKIQILDGFFEKFRSVHLWGMVQNGLDVTLWLCVFDILRFRQRIFFSKQMLFWIHCLILDHFIHQCRDTMITALPYGRFKMQEQLLVIPTPVLFDWGRYCVSLL